jgi:hypothetical protein
VARELKCTLNVIVIEVQLCSRREWESRVRLLGMISSLSKRARELESMRCERDAYPFGRLVAFYVKNAVICICSTDYVLYHLWQHFSRSDRPILCTWEIHLSGHPPRGRLPLYILAVPRRCATDDREASLVIEDGPLSFADASLYIHSRMVPRPSRMLPYISIRGWSPVLRFPIYPWLPIVTLAMHSGILFMHPDP